MNKFFTHPMRLFFSSAALFVILTCIDFLSSDHFIQTHKIFFINIVPAFAYGGFILTAIPDWTNYKKSIKPFSIFIYLIILLAVILLPLNTSLSGIFITLFWFSLLVFCSYLIYLDRNTKNYTLLLFLFLFTLLQAIFSYTLSAKFLTLQIHLNIAAIVFVSFRISVMMGYQALKQTDLKDPVFIPNAIYKNLAITFLLLYLISETFLPLEVSGFIALGCGFILIAKLKELHYFVLIKKHYLLLYYLLQLLGGIGYLWQGLLQILGEESSAPLHLIAICYLFAIIFQVMMMAGLRHSGFAEPNLPKLSLLAMLFLCLAGFSRAILSEWHFAFYLQIPALLMLFAASFYLANFIPIFIRHAFSDDPD